jgi:hypothetical protein
MRCAPRRDKSRLNRSLNLSFGWSHRSIPPSAAQFIAFVSLTTPGTVPKYFVKLDHQDRSGYCALHFAGQNKHTDVARTLLEAGALTDLRDMHGNTPLWTAGFSALGDYGVFQLLLRHGASLDNRNNVGKTVRDLAHTLFPDPLDGLVANA